MRTGACPEMELGAVRAVDETDEEPGVAAAADVDAAAPSAEGAVTPGAGVQKRCWTPCIRAAACGIPMASGQMCATTTAWRHPRTSSIRMTTFAGGFCPS